jgi:hypothetical protein
VIVYPLVVTVLPVPTLILSKTPEAKPEFSVTLAASAGKTPFNKGVPPSVAAVVRSYCLSLAVTPVMVTGFGFTTLEVVATLAEADIDTNVTLPLYEPGIVVAPNRTKMEVLPMLPPGLALTLTEFANPVLVVRDTSKPLGAVMVTCSDAPIDAVKVKLTSLDTDP